MAKLLKSILLLIIFLSATLSLVADENHVYRIGVVELSDSLQSMGPLVVDVLKEYERAFVFEEHQTSSLQQRLTREQNKTLEVALERAYQESDVVRIEQLKTDFGSEIVVHPSTMTVSYSLEVYHAHLASALLKSTEAMKWYMQEKGFDALILLEATMLDSFLRFRMLSYEMHQDRASVMMDRLVQHAFLQSLKPELERICFAFSAKNQWAALILSHSPPGLNLTIDGVKQSLRDGLLFLRPGTYQMHFRADNYRSKDLSIVLEGNELFILRPDLQLEEQKSLNLYSNQGMVQWSQAGKVLDTSLSISLQNPVYPFSLTVNKEGFQPLILHVSTPPSTDLSVSMLPAQLASDSLLLQVQKDFYKRLRNTILLFGAYVGVTALSKTYDTTNPFWELGLVSTSSLALVSSVALILELATYANMATDGASY